MTTSVTRLGDFWKFSMTNIHAKVAQMLVWLFGLIKTLCSTKAYFATFWATFGKIGLLFIPTSWSHWWLPRFTCNVPYRSTRTTWSSISGGSIPARCRCSSRSRRRWRWRRRIGRWPVQTFLSDCPKFWQLKVCPTTTGINSTLSFGHKNRTFMSLYRISIGIRDQQDYKTFLKLLTIAVPCDSQCDQIGRFIAFWATFQSLRQQLFCPNCPHF